MPTSSLILKEQILALRVHFEPKMQFLRDSSREAVSFKHYLSVLRTWSEKSHRGRESALTKKARRGLQQMERASLLKAEGSGRSGKRYTLSNIGIAYLIQLENLGPPTVGTKGEKWDDELIVQSLLMDLKSEISTTEARETAEIAKEYMTRLGWGGRNMDDK